MKKSTRIAAALLLMLAGLGVILYPWAKAAYFEYNKNRLLAAWDTQEISVPVPVPAPTSLPATSEPVLLGNVLEEDTDPAFDLEYVKKNMLGVITIEKIKLRSPILRGDTKKNLDICICLTKDSPALGEKGNAVLAGHKSRIYGRHFSRLMEISKGDAVLLDDGNNTYTYEVYKTIRTNDQDVDAMTEADYSSIITLITCDYTQKPIGRFMVKAKLIDTAKK